MSESLPQKIELLPDGEIKTKLSNCLKVEGLTDSLTLARACAETLVRELYLGLNAPAPFLLDDCIRGLRDETINPGTVPVHVVNYLDNCKVLGNPAAHGRSVAVDLPLHLSDLLRVAEWYYRSFVPGMKGRANSGRAAPSRRPTSDLREVPMVNELATRGRAKGSLASKLYAAISGPGGVSPLLRLIQEQCPAYDDCGLSHACRIMTRVHGILTPAAREQLNAPELFSFVYATISNTAGLSAQAAEAQLEKALRGCALSDQEIKRWAAAINVVLDAQTASRDQLRSHVGFGKDTTIDQYTIRPRLLAMLLRIGDLLDLDSERPDPHCVSAYWGASPARSRRRRGKVEHFVCNPQQLRIRVVCEDKLSHQTASRWLEHLREDIAFAALFVFRQDLTAFQLPAPEVCVERAAGAAYTLWPLRFEIDQDGHLWEVLRRSVYTGPYDYVREIVSNAIDACVRYMFDHAGTPISPQNANSPRSWVLPGYDPLVLVLFDRHESRLAICDNGVGMDTEDLQNFLFKVAGRGAARRKRDVELPTIGQFGVGFISILTRADSVRLATCRHTGGNGLLVDITSGLREASVEELRGSPDPGTSIVLHLKEKEPDLSRYGEADARAHLERILLYPSIRVALIDCDALQKLHSQVQDLDPSPSPPISEWFAVAETRIKPLHQIIEEADGIVRRASEIMRRENHRRKDESERTLEQNKRLTAAHQARVDERERVKQKGGDPGPMIPPPQLADALPLLSTHWAEVSSTAIEPKEPPQPPIDSPLLVCLRTDGRVRRMRRIGSKQTVQPQDLAMLSILVVPVMIDDPGLGIEWRSLHSFVLGEGVLKDRVAYDPRINNRSLARYFPHGISLGHEDSWDEDEPNDELYDALEGGLLDKEVSLSRILKASDELRRATSAPELVYKSLAIGPSRIEYEEVDYDGERSRPREVFDHLTTETLSARTQNVLGPIAEWYKVMNVICQDGIKLPKSESVSRLAPIGATCGVANFTASSRLALNISRNAVDESPEGIRQWRQGVGMIILKAVRRRVTACLARCDISNGYGGLWLGTTGGDSITTEHDWDASAE